MCQKYARPSFVILWVTWLRPPLCWYHMLDVATFVCLIEFLEDNIDVYDKEVSCFITLSSDISFSFFFLCVEGSAARIYTPFTPLLALVRRKEEVIFSRKFYPKVTQQQFMEAKLKLKSSVQDLYCKEISPPN